MTKSTKTCCFTNTYC